ncbi:MAG: sensor histidine kinase [Phenylobacterium sp.]|nr:sensor histidine kinase [Phenylobacterium sp.]
MPQNAITLSERGDSRILGAALGALVCAVLVVSAVVVANLKVIRSAEDLSVHTYRVLDNAQEMLGALRAEAAIVGHDAAVLSAADLATLEAAKRHTDEVLERLHNLTRDNDLQQSRLHSVRLTLSNLRARPASDSTGSPGLLMGRAGTDIAQVRTTERELLATREARAGRAFVTAYWTLLIGAVVGVLTAGAIWWHAAGVLIRAREAAEKAKELGAQLLHVGRLNAMGEMAGTLAHELNQPLTAIASYTSAARRLAERDKGANPRLAELLRKAAEQTVRAGQIIRRVRDFVSRGEVQQHPERVSAMATEATALATSGGIRDGVTVRHKFDRDADMVLADRIQIQQVLVNLVRNATEASATSAASEHREVCVSTSPYQANLVRIDVADTGSGVTPEVAERLFQPFVTSKADGMGVGLSICKSIVEAHGGSIWMEQNKAGGATFSFTLQRSVPEEVADAR